MRTDPQLCTCSHTGSEHLQEGQCPCMECDCPYFRAKPYSLYDLETQITELERQKAELLEAAKLRRNTIIWNNGEWIAVPREDFDALRAAIAKAETSYPRG